MLTMKWRNKTERFGEGVQIGRTTKGCVTAAGTIATVEIVVAGYESDADGVLMKEPGCEVPCLRHFRYIEKSTSEINMEEVSQPTRIDWLVPEENERKEKEKREKKRKSKEIVGIVIKLKEGQTKKQIKQDKAELKQ